MTNQTEREKFEKWAKANFKNPSLARSHIGPYYSSFIESHWECWQARASLQGGERVCKCNIGNDTMQLKACPKYTKDNYGAADCIYCAHDEACHARKEG